MPTVSDRGAIHDAVKQGTSTLARLAAMSSPTDAAAQHAAAQQAIGASELHNHALLLAAPRCLGGGEGWEPSSTARAFFAREREKRK